MNLENVKKILKEVESSIDMSHTWFKLNDNTKILLEYGVSNDFSSIDDFEVETFYFTGTFYDCVYSFAVKKESIKEDYSDIVGLSGDSKLFDSFENFLEDDDTWELLKMLCLKLEELDKIDEFE